MYFVGMKMALLFLDYIPLVKSNIGQSSNEKLNVKGKRWTWVENLSREIHLKPGWQKLREGTNGLRRKVWNLDFKP